jgi:hypothetical protein
LAASLRGEFARSRIATDRLGKLEIQEVRSVPGLSRSEDAIRDPCSWGGSEEDLEDGRGIDHDHG